MSSGAVKDVNDIKNITNNLSAENKKYVIAVANALLFSQQKNEKPKAVQPSVQQCLNKQQ